MNYTKEFYDIMENFENNVDKFISIGSQGKKRESKEMWGVNHYYCDGGVNEAFKIYLLGVQFGKVYYR